jgi:hypothetical protein
MYIYITSIYIMLRSFLVAMMISPLPMIPCDEFVEGSWRATEKL